MILVAKDFFRLKMNINNYLKRRILVRSFQGAFREEDFADKKISNGGSMSGNISYVFRAPSNAISDIESEYGNIKNLFSCDIDNLVVFFIENNNAMKKFREMLSVDILLSKKIGYDIVYNKLKPYCSDVYKIAKTGDNIYESSLGHWICKRETFNYINKSLEEMHFGSSDFKKEELDSVYWTEKTISLRRDIEFFGTSKSWFDKKDLPYARSYLLYGPPGNGKTSAIRAISKFFNSTPETFSFTAKWADPDTDFISWITGESSSNKNDYFDDELDEIVDGPFSNTFGLKSKNNNQNPMIRILLLEDIDRFFSKDSNIPVSFSTILNALDGVVQRRNSIVIATANHPEKIDTQVLFRPGRFDLRIPFDPPDSDSLLGFLNSLTHDDKIGDDTRLEVLSMCKGHSFAFVKGIYLAAANKAFSRSSTIISDDDILASCREFTNNLGRDIKSSKSSVGF